MSTQEQIAVTYDLPPEFYALWLDERMNYSCALFEGPEDTLEAAQVRKLRWIDDAARIRAGSSVLEIGCGWGANLQFLTRDLGLRDVTGITLSRSQADHIARKAWPGVKVECVSYLDYRPERKFDAIASIGMFEHIATPEQARSGQHIDIYRDYFRRAHEWTAPGAWFGLQAVVGALLPRKAATLREIGWATYSIFPGAIAPRIEAIVASVNPYWEIMELRTRREHYARTTDEWRRRLRASEAQIKERWGEARFAEYDRYLSACVTAFEGGYQSLVQIALRRID